MELKVFWSTWRLGRRKKSKKINKARKKNKKRKPLKVYNPSNTIDQLFLSVMTHLLKV